MKGTLELSGFLANKEKSVWKPSRCLTWLGVTLDLDKNTYKITEERIFSLLNSIDNILKSPYTSARILSRLAGKIVSTKFVLSNIIRLKTRSIYKTIDRQLSWDRKFNILNYPEAHREILFWRENIKRLNKKSSLTDNLPKLTISSDASDTGIGGICTSMSILCHKSFNNKESGSSSTWRELEAINFSLRSFGELIRGKSMLWLTDNRAAMYITRSGSAKTDLQTLAVEIFSSFITDWMFFPDAVRLLKQGNSKSSLLGSERYKGGLMALKIRS